MPDALLLLIALAANVAGLGWLALAMDTHWKQVRGSAAKSAATTATLRCIGFAALFASLLICLRVDHGSMASLVWVMALAGAALAIAFTLAWQPRWLGMLVPWTRATGSA